MMTVEFITALFYEVDEQLVQTPPRHPLHQWELKPTGFPRVKSPLGSSPVPPYNMPIDYIL